MMKPFLVTLLFAACTNDPGEAWCTEHPGGSGVDKICTVGLDACDEMRILANTFIPERAGNKPQWTMCELSIYLPWCYNTTRSEWADITGEPILRCRITFEDCENSNREELGDSECLKY
jgi:hypothetical protein